MNVKKIQRKVKKNWFENSLKDATVQCRNCLTIWNKSFAH